MFSGTFVFVWLVLAVLMIASVWTVYTKAGKPGWASIVPIYNLIVHMRIVGRPLWWLLLLLIPLVNIVVGIMLVIDLAKSFGKSAAYGVGLLLLPMIFYPMLAFGSSTYQGPAGAAT